MFVYLEDTDRILGNTVIQEAANNYFLRDFAQDP